jgi:hypothetical protein
VCCVIGAPGPPARGRRIAVPPSSCGSIAQSEAVLCHRSDTRPRIPVGVTCADCLRNICAIRS